MIALYDLFYPQPPSPFIKNILPNKNKETSTETKHSELPPSVKILTKHKIYTKKIS